MKKTFLIISFFLLVSFKSDHKFYIALTDIEFNKKEKTLQMIMNVFIDDIELAINKEQKTNLELDTKNELKASDDHIKKYLNKHFNLKINNEPVSYKFIGKEYDGDIVYFYMEVKNISKINTISFHNTVLIKQFPTQQNLIKVKNGNERKSLFLNNTNSNGKILF